MDEALPAADAPLYTSKLAAPFDDASRPDVQPACPAHYNCSLRLEAQDVALSRLKHGFESRRERQTTKTPRISAGFFVVRTQR